MRSGGPPTSATRPPSNSLHMTSVPEMTIDAHSHVGVELYRYLRDEYPYCQDLRTLFTHADRTGVSHCIVFPCVSYQAMDLVQLRDSKVVLEGRLDSVPYGRENRRFLKECLRLLSLAPTADDSLRQCGPAAQGARAARATAAVACGIPFLRFENPAVRDPGAHPLAADPGSAFLNFAREHDLPFIIHSSIDAGDRYSQCADILHVAEHNPDLRFCLAHSCRFHRPSLERVAALPNTWFDWFRPWNSLRVGRDESYRRRRSRRSVSTPTTGIPVACSTIWRPVIRTR
jgi:hypothetical protein